MMRMSWRAMSVLVALVLIGARATGEGLPAEPEGYRLGDYRSPPPATVAGRPGIDTAEAERLWRSGKARFIDVMPAVRRPEGLPTGAVWAPRPRRSIPGSLWLPDVGRGVLTVDLDEWFHQTLARLTQDDTSAPLVFFCLGDCWMSWNAAKRALSWGYSGTLWYRDGTDGWEAGGLPLAEVTPAADAPR
jgi:PQQ-dependent catabolism-associated CXXCW motif protein